MPILLPLILIGGVFIYFISSNHEKDQIKNEYPFYLRHKDLFPPREIMLRKAIIERYHTLDRDYCQLSKEERREVRHTLRSLISSQLTEWTVNHNEGVAMGHIEKPAEDEATMVKYLEGIPLDYRCFRWYDTQIAF